MLFSHETAIVCCERIICYIIIFFLLFYDASRTTNKNEKISNFLRIKFDGRTKKLALPKEIIMQEALSIELNFASLFCGIAYCIVLKILLPSSKRISIIFCDETSKKRHLKRISLKRISKYLFKVISQTKWKTILLHGSLFG